MRIQLCPTLRLTWPLAAASLLLAPGAGADGRSTAVDSRPVDVVICLDTSRSRQSATSVRSSSARP